MKNIVTYINESNNTFLDTIKDVVKSNKCDFNIEDSKNTQKPENTCFSCGKPIPPDESFCEDCKAKMADINTRISTERCTNQPYNWN